MFAQKSPTTTISNYLKDLCKDNKNKEYALVAGPQPHTLVMYKYMLVEIFVDRLRAGVKYFDL